MYFSRGRRFLFLHAPKTGGTALTLALEARAMKDDVIISDTPKGRARAGRQKAIKTAGRLWKHSTLADLDGLAGVADPGLLIVTLVRNPWDRMVSYYHWLQLQSFDHPAVGLAQTLDFSAFLNRPVIAESFRRWPYGAWLRDRSGMEQPGLFLRLEQIGADLAPFEAHLGFRLAPLPRVNESARPRDWRPFYSDRDAALLGAICAEDIARFSYDFDV
ncbi:Type II secretory pathway, pullulanase PulA [Frigidibacter sp. RF13]|uniref:Type II secretory pathway, pullulanase PulA n=1 Tax=Frigidibacter sp. RF13 TaxID=2997340 RepID=UPI00226E0384|nr:Type II secretory pathway, pullulanase PulA [Frigidibacter sp. RF13]MCY1126148.1 Type II secretory pathway, pullulanase PulA [Frigidibacter sp. RF13]